MSDIIEQNSDNNIIDSLLIEYRENRNDLKIMLEEIKEIKDKIDSLFPEKLDNRYTRFFEEKVKTASEMFKTLLDIRKEISKSLKDEIELRRKITNESQKEFDIDVRELAEKIEMLK